MLRPVTVSIVLLLVGCKSDSERARLMLNQAYGLMRQEKPGDAKRVLNELTVKYGHTQEATEANHLLATFKAAEDVGKAKADQTWRNAILTALASFMLDCGRFPTKEEGLRALLTDPGIKGWSGPYWRSESSNALDMFEYTPHASGEPDVVPMTAK